MVRNGRDGRDGEFRSGDGRAGDPVRDAEIIIVPPPVMVDVLIIETPVGSSGASLTLGPDGFFDGGLFDPDVFDDVIERQKR